MSPTIGMTETALRTLLAELERRAGVYQQTADSLHDNADANDAFYAYQGQAAGYRGAADMLLAALLHGRPATSTPNARSPEAP